jgi:hypothetical protein
MAWTDFFYDTKANEKEEVKQKFTEKKTVIPMTGPSTLSNVDYHQDISTYLRQCNIQGPDFAEFKEAVEDPSLNTLTEKQKYKAILSSFVVMKVPADKLIKTADFYLKKIAERVELFKKDMEKAYKRDVTDRQDSVKALEIENENLTKKIQENIVKMGQLNQDIQKDTLRLNGEDQAFKLAADNQTAIIEKHILNIKTYSDATTTSV